MCISLLDGIGALWEVFAPTQGSLFRWAGIFSSEVEPACLRVLHHRFPTLHHLGDVQLVTDDMVEQLINDRLQEIDILLLAGGSPCQQLSNAGNSRDGLGGAESGAFAHYARIARHAKDCLFP